VLIKQKVAEMKPVALHCTKLVHQAMIEMIRNCLDTSHRFPAINAAIMKITVSMLDRMAKFTKLLVESYIDVQAMSAFTSNPNYIEEIKKSMSNLNPVGLGRLPVQVYTDSSNDDLLMLVDGAKSAAPNDPEISKHQAELFVKVRGLVKAYFDIVRDQVADHVPKTLLHSLIYASSNKIDAELVR